MTQCATVSHVDTHITNIHIPEPGYELIRQIKERDGRIEFLDEWITEIKKLMIYRRANFRNLELKGSKGPQLLRISDHKPYQVRTFQYDTFARDVPPDVYRRVVVETPPKFPKSLRIAAPLPGRKSAEWNRLAAAGRRAEMEIWPNRSMDLSCAAPRDVTQGLWDLSELIRIYKREKEELREELTIMAVDEQWDDHLFGKDDGRLMIKPAKPKRELRDADNAKTRYSHYFKTMQRSGSTVVRFYAPGESDD